MEKPNTTISNQGHKAMDLILFSTSKLHCVLLIPLKNNLWGRVQSREYLLLTVIPERLVLSDPYSAPNPEAVLDRF